MDSAPVALFTSSYLPQGRRNERQTPAADPPRKSRESGRGAGGRRLRDHRREARAGKGPPCADKNPSLPAMPWKQTRPHPTMQPPWENGERDARSVQMTGSLSGGSTTNTWEHISGRNRHHAKTRHPGTPRPGTSCIRGELPASNYGRAVPASFIFPGSSL